MVRVLTPNASATSATFQGLPCSPASHSNNARAWMNLEAAVFPPCVSVSSRRRSSSVRVTLYRGARPHHSPTEERSQYAKFNVLHHTSGYARGILGQSQRWSPRGTDFGRGAAGVGGVGLVQGAMRPAGPDGAKTARANVAGRPATTDKPTQQIYQTSPDVQRGAFRGRMSRASPPPRPDGQPRALVLFGLLVERAFGPGMARQGRD